MQSLYLLAVCDWSSPLLCHAHVGHVTHMDDTKGLGAFCRELGAQEARGRSLGRPETTLQLWLAVSYLSRHCPSCQMP